MNKKGFFVYSPNASRKGQIIIVVLLVLTGTALFLWAVLAGVLGGRQDFFELDAPGAADVSLTQPGDYTVFHEYYRTHDSQEIVRPEGVEWIEVTLRPLDGGEPVRVRTAEDGKPYAIRRRLREALFTFEIAAPGAYRFAASYPPEDPGPPARLVVSQTYARQVFGAFLKGIVILLVTGVLVALVLLRVPRKETRGL